MVIKIVELMGISDKNFEDAIAVAVKRASKTLRGITGVDVVRQTCKVVDGKVTEYRVDLKIAFIINE